MIVGLFLISYQQEKQLPQTDKNLDKQFVFENPDQSQKRENIWKDLKFVHMEMFPWRLSCAEEIGQLGQSYRSHFVIRDHD